MSYRYLLLILGVAISSLLIVGTANALRTQQDSQEILKQVVLQKTDFPPDVETYTFSSDEVKLEDFDGQISAVTMPFIAEGFVDAYRVSGWYAVDLENEAFKEAGQGVSVENMAFLFEDESQATAAYTQQVRELNDKILPDLAGITVEAFQIDRFQGQLIQYDHTDDGLDFTAYHLFGTVDNRTLHLLVYGLPNPVGKQTFEQLVEKLASYQSAG